MRTTINKTNLLTVLTLLLSTCLFGQQQILWKDVKESDLAKEEVERLIMPNEYRTVQLDFAALKALLQTAPMRFTEAAKEQEILLTLPMPDGGFEQFRMVEAPVMHPDLQARYPQMRAYAGKGIEDPTAYLRCGFTHKGFHAMLRSARHNSIFIDAYAKGDTEHYISYFKKDFEKDAAFICEVEGVSEVKKGDSKNVGTVPDNFSDCQLRLYRLALACTGEYASFHGGNKPDVMAEYNVAIARVSGIYEVDATITLELVPNTDDLIFLNAGSDPYTNNNGGTMLGQNQTTCNNVIGVANYDIGHVFSTGGGGIASLAVPCTGSKARGVTGLPSPINDPFYVDYVAHEMGHQFGANHTQNNNCQRNGSTAMEPGSASTIMGYAGICTPNVQNNSDDHFHAVSLAEIHANVTFGNSSGCPQIISHDNNAPSITIANDTYTLPISTPFELTGIGDDPDGDILTYCWEQMDPQAATMPPQPTNNSGPAFRSISPHESPTRYFPNLTAILSNQTPTWEVLPSVSRNMNFRGTVRDNAPIAPCQDFVDVDLIFSANAGPFVVNNPNTNVTWLIGDSEEVTWDVANTDQAPVNCENVDILLSLDGGLTYPVTLASGVPNSGNFMVSVPDNATSTARVKVICSDNIFFDVSNQNFDIETPPMPTFLLNVEPSSITTCESETATYTLDINTLLGFEEPITFNLIGAPPNAGVVFSENPFTPPGTVELTINDLAVMGIGSHILVVEATSATVTRTFDLVLTIFPDIEDTVLTLGPIDGESGVTLNPLLTWNTILNAEAYLIEISTSPSFSTIIESATVTGTAYQTQNLTAQLQVFYWRVKGMNPCGDGPITEASAFQTGGKDCTTYDANNLPLNIPNNQTGTFTTTLDVPDDFLLAEVNTSLVIGHTWVGDLRVMLESPLSTEVLLFDQPGVPADQFGCDGDNIEATFNDNADNTAEDFENSCDPGMPSISGDFQPIDPLALFIDESSLGNWTLHITDAFDEDGGALTAWSLELCGVVEADAPELANNILTVSNGQNEIITNTYLSITDTAPELAIYTLLSLPTSGVILLNSMSLEIGGQFTQADINNGAVSYEQDGSLDLQDSFTFDVQNSEGGWLHAQVFLIEIIQNTLIVQAILDNDIDCFEANNGQISIAVSGGTMPWSYSLDGVNFQDDNIFDGLAEGTYTITVMDINGFSMTTNEVVITNPSELTGSAVVNNFDIEINASGGTGDLMYSINGIDFQIENTFTVTVNGTYNIIVSDVNGCTTEIQAIVAVNTLAVQANLDNEIDCFEANNGQISVNVNGGTTPFSYSLDGSNFQDASIFENLSAGTYTVTVMDSEGFTAETNAIVISNPTALTAEATVLMNEVTVTAEGGTGNLTYSINGVDFQDSHIFSNLDNGVYTITVMDANGCTFETTSIVAVNTLLVSASLVQEIDCNGADNGSITINVGGGSPPFQYSSDGINFQDSNVFESLAPGTYTFTVIDADNLTAATNAVIVSEPAQIIASSAVTGYDISIMANGGTGDLTYSLDGVEFQASPNFTGNPATTYSVIVQDENGCQNTVEATVIVQPISIIVEPSGSLPSCHNTSDGSLVFQAEGGIPPYQFSLNGGDLSTPTVQITFENLSGGSHEITVMDAGGFTVSSMISLSAPSAIIAMASVDNYTVMINANGGTGNLQYSLNGVDFQNENVFSPLPSGNYLITIQDENGCQNTVEATVDVEILTGTAIIDQMPSCHDATDGQISITPVGGVAPYQYSLDGINFQDSPVFENLAIGIHEVTIQDIGGFTTTVMIKITAPTALTATAQGIGYDLIIDAEGGTMPYQYSLDGINFQDSNVFETITNGTYTVTILDANGCETTAEGTVFVQALSVIADLGNDITCHNANDATIIIEIDGGAAPFQYSLDGGITWQNEPIFEGLSEGEYIVTVMDAGGFTIDTPPISVTNPTEITATVDVFGQEIAVDAMGGTGILQYSLDGQNFQEESIFEMVDNGNYDVIVIDDNGCTFSILATVNAPVEIVFDFMHISCHDGIDGSITVSEVIGGFEPFLFSFNDGEFLEDIVWEDLEMGEFIIAVQDATGYIFYAHPVILDSPSPIELDTELNGNNLTINASGGTSPFQYSIDGGTTFDPENNTFNDLESGEYTIVVMDANGCTAETTVVITSTRDLEFNLLFEVQPNPSSGYFQLIINQLTQRKLSITIFDTAGKLVFDEAIEKNSTNLDIRLDLNELPSGTYQLWVSDGEMVGSERLVIIK